MKKILSLLILCLFSLKGVAQDTLTSELEELEQKVGIQSHPESQLATYNAKIDSLKNQNSALKSLLKEAQKETEDRDLEIASLKKEIISIRNVEMKDLKDKNEALQKSVIQASSYYFYLPYDEYGVVEIAIPAFNATKGTDRYMKYQNRLQLLENYKSDISTLIEFLTQSEKDISSGLTSLMVKAGLKHLNELKQIPLYNRYKSYDEGDDTYLGGKILKIEKLLGAPTAATKDQLKAIRIELEGLINSK